MKKRLYKKAFKQIALTGKTRIKPKGLHGKKAEIYWQFMRMAFTIYQLRLCKDVVDVMDGAFKLFMEAKQLQIIATQPKLHCC